MSKFKFIMGIAAAATTVAMATYTYFSEATIKQNALPKMQKRLAEKLNELHRVLLNKDYPIPEIK